MRTWAPVSSTALLLLGGCSDLLGLGDFKPGDAGVGGSGGATTTTSSSATQTGGTGTTTSSSTGGSGGATTTSSTGGSGGGTTSSTGGGGGAGGAGTLCTPNQVVACPYGGPAGTEGVGQCKAGTQKCAADGMSFGACSGAVLPAVERCDTPAVDEDCDGLPACTGAFRWARTWGDANPQIAQAVAVDAQGNVVVAGIFYGTLDFGGGPVTADTSDAFVVKLDRRGVRLWSKVVKGTGSQSATAVAIHPDGTIVVTGSTDAAADFTDAGGGTIAGNGGNDVFVLALDPDGEHLWSKVFGGPNADAPQAIAIDPAGAGAVVIAGGHAGGIDFGDGTKLTATGTDVFVAKLALSDGSYVWAKSAGGTGLDRADGVAVDGTGAVTAAGFFSGNMAFGPTLTSAGGNDIFVVRFSTGGNHVWSKSFGATVGQVATGVASDASGNVVVVGYAAGSFSAGGTSLGSGISAAQSGFAFKLNSAGTHLWSKPLGGSDAYPCVALDSQGRVVIGAKWSGGALGFGGMSLSSAGGQDIAVAKLDPGGNHLWSRRFGDTGDQGIEALAVGPNGEVVVAGGNIATLDFGGGPLMSKGQNDIYVGELAP